MQGKWKGKHNKWKAIAAFSSLIFVTDAFAADAPPELIDCTPQTIFLCTADKSACDSVPVTDVQGAYRIRVNLKQNTTQTFEGSTKTSEANIDRVERYDNLLFLQGQEAVLRKDQKLRYGWTAIIDPSTGRLTVSSIANGMGSILNGNCRVVNGGEQ